VPRLADRRATPLSQVPTVRSVVWSLDRCVRSLALSITAAIEAAGDAAAAGDPFPTARAVGADARGRPRR